MGGAAYTVWVTLYGYVPSATSLAARLTTLEILEFFLVLLVTPKGDVHTHLSSDELKQL